MGFSHKSILNFTCLFVEGRRKNRIFRSFKEKYGVPASDINFLIVCLQLREHIGYIHKVDLRSVLHWYSDGGYYKRLRAIRLKGWLSLGVGNTIVITEAGEMVISNYCRFVEGEFFKHICRISALARSPRRAGRVSSLLSSLPTAGKGSID